MMDGHVWIWNLKSKDHLILINLIMMNVGNLMHDHLILINLIMMNVGKLLQDHLILINLIMMNVDKLNARSFNIVLLMMNSRNVTNTNLNKERSVRSFQRGISSM